MGAQWLGGRVLDSRPRGRGFEPHRRHCVMSLSKNINLSLVLVQPRKICLTLFITERLLMGHKDSKQTIKRMLQWFHFEKGGGLYVFTEFINMQEVSSHPPTFVLYFHIRMP